MSAGPEPRAGGAPAPAGRVRAVLIMHGGLGSALLEAARSVYGPIDDVPVLSNEGLSKAQIEEHIAGVVADWSEGGLVLTDFWGGSCHVCAQSVARGNRRIILLTGLNLPMLLHYLHNRDHSTVEQLAEGMIQRGRDQIRTQHGDGR